MDFELSKSEYIAMLFALDVGIGSCIDTLQKISLSGIPLEDYSTETIEELKSTVDALEAQLSLARKVDDRATFSRRFITEILHNPRLDPWVMEWKVALKMNTSDHDRTVVELNRLLES